MSLNWRHPAVRIGVWIVGGIAVVVAVVFLIGRFFPDNPQGPTKSEKTADSLDITRPIDKALLDSLDARMAARALIGNRAETGSRVSQERADRSRRRADSLAIAREWEGAYIERTIEADTLRKAVAQKDTVITALKADTVDLRSQLGIVSRRLATTEAVVVGLRWDLQQARKCKILGLINCPSRIQTAALTVVAVVGIDRYRNR